LTPRPSYPYCLTLAPNNNNNIYIIIFIKSHCMTSGAQCGISTFSSNVKCNTKVMSLELAFK
jgi:hypothetical protein